LANGWDFNHQRSKSFRFQGWPGRCAHAYVASIYGAVSMAQANTPISLGRDVPGMGKAMGNLWKNAGNYTEIIWEHGKNHETPMGFNGNFMGFI